MSGPRRARTDDLRIKSPLLYRLSHRRPPSRKHGGEALARPAKVTGQGPRELVRWRLDGPRKHRRSSTSPIASPCHHRFMATQTKHIGILLFDEVEELDAVGPWEVLAYWTKNHPDEGYAISCISKDGRPVVAAKGLTIGAHHSYATMPALDVLIYPGGWGTRAHLKDDEQLGWVRRQRESVPLMTSVCTGALVYAAAGLLTGHVRPPRIGPRWSYSPNWTRRSRSGRISTATSGQRRRDHRSRRLGRHRYGTTSGGPAGRRG